MKTRSTIAAWIGALLCWAASSTMALGANVQTVKDGNWSDASTWSSGVVPAATDNIRVRHHVQHGSTLFLEPMGVITIEVDARLKVVNDLNNKGNVLNYDSLIVGGVENFGGIENYATMVCVGGFENRVPGSVSNFGSIFLTGDLVNRWKLLNEGNVFMKGDFENFGVTQASAGVQGYFEVCGSVKHHSGASVFGTEYICLLCGGSYDTEPGRVGDFVQQCLPFVASISDFRAEPNSASVQLSWTTQTETNSDWFIVERSGPNRGATCKIGSCGAGREFVEIGRVRAAGTSQGPLDYQFSDGKPLSGLNYYRLRVLDKNGTQSYSMVVEAIIEGQGMQLLAYPNPNNSVLHIQAVGGSGQAAKLTLYGIDGKRVWERTIELGDTPVRHDIQVCDFAAGVYLLKLAQGNQEEVRKLIFAK